MKIDPLPLPDDGLWSRLRATPLVDLLRGRIIGRLDVCRVIAEAKLPEPLSGFIYQTVLTARRRRRTRFDLARSLVERCQADLAGGSTPEELVLSLDDPRKIDLYSAIGANLPAPIAALIQRVVRRTRLWQAERLDVARELAEHFRDGLATGQTPDQLIESFGALRRAARLIRRAKLRNRPLVWRIWRRAMQGIGAVLALIIVSYLALFARFVLVHPTLTHNYALELTAPSRAVPEADRAWPLYRQAQLTMTPYPKSDGVPIDVSVEKPGGEHWLQVVVWLDANRAALETVRQGAARPSLGFVHGDSYDPDKIDLKKNEPLYHMLLPYLEGMWQLHIALRADAWRAATENDPATFVADINSLMGMTNQLHADLSFIWIDMKSFSIMKSALTLVDEMLAKDPTLLGDAELQHLAHLFAGFGGGGNLRCRLDAERLFFSDLYQRLYSNDGNGDGRPTHEGMQLLQSITGAPQSEWLLNSMDDLVIGPFYSAWLLSRRAMIKKTDEIFDHIEANFNCPLWQWTNEQNQLIGEEFCSQPHVVQLRYAPIVLFAPGINSAAFWGERLTQLRDATLVVIALELYHRRHGTWPESLNDLVPDLLPEIPPDRFTGRPLIYRLLDDRPVLYSIGPDQVDDGGRSMANPPDRWNYNQSARGSQDGDHSLEGDWILWPPVEQIVK